MKRNYFLVAVAVIVATLIVTLAIYPRLPGQIPMHWNFRGDVNRYGSKANAFLLPGVMAAVVMLFSVLPWLSPKQFEVKPFRSTYLYIMILIVALIAYLHALMLWAALSKPLNINRSLLGVLFLFLILLGNVLGKVRRNFYIGVRTPWTLASEKVWYATHRFAAKAFVIAGLFGLLSVLVATTPVIGLVILIAAALASVIYSLVYYKRLERRNEL
jgi:immunity protein, SdpI family